MTDVDADFLRRLAPFVRALTRYFDAEVSGLDRIPEGPCLFVANHNAGTSTPDSLVFGLAWLEHCDYRDPFLGLGHDTVFDVPGLGDFVRRLGVIAAKADGAMAAFAAGKKVLVYPGGQHEALRPSRDRDRIDFGGHQGFVKLAMRAGVPVVPVVTAGAHDGWYVLTRGDAIARRLPFLRRWRLETVPIAFGLPTGLLVPWIPFVPLPRKMVMEVLPARVLEGDADDAAVVAKHYAAVTSEMQSALDRLVARLPRSQRRCV